MIRLFVASRPRGEVRLVVAEHPAGRRVELEREVGGVTTSIAIGADELEELAAALVEARKEVVER